MSTQEILDRLKAVCEAEHLPLEPWEAELREDTASVVYYGDIDQPDIDDSRYIADCASGHDRCIGRFTESGDWEIAKFIALSRTALPAQQGGLAQLYALAIEAQNMGVQMEPADVISIIDDALATLKEALK